MEPALMLSMSFENMKYFCVVFVFNSKIVINLDVEKKKGHFRTAPGLLDEGVHTCPLSINRSRPSEVQ